MLITQIKDVNTTLLGNVIQNESLEGISLCGLDPNRNQMLDASYGDGKNPHQIRRCSTKEYYIYTGSKRHKKREKERMIAEGIDLALINTPTAKSVNLSTYLQYINYLLRHFQNILEFNGSSTAESRFHLYQGRQRATQEMENILINSGKKYNKSKRKNTKKNRKNNKNKKIPEAKDDRQATPQDIK